MADWNGQLFMAQRQLVEVIEKKSRGDDKSLSNFIYKGRHKPIYPPNPDLQRST